MIGSIKGKVILMTEKFVVIETNSGVGYKVNMFIDSKSLSAVNLGSDISLLIHTHVREDSLDLYGFHTYPELEFFEMLINVSGIGPKGALAILNINSIDTLKRAIKSGDTGYLTKISGIGRKTAEKIIIELRDKMGSDESGSSSTSLREELDALEALKSLGYSQNEAREALQKVAPDLDTNKKIKEALKILGGK
jgi:Holliday junction DNA helicase RuvA